MPWSQHARMLMHFVYLTTCTQLYMHGHTDALTHAHTHACTHASKRNNATEDFAFSNRVFSQILALSLTADVLSANHDARFLNVVT